MQILPVFNFLAHLLPRLAIGIGSIVGVALLIWLTLRLLSYLHYFRLPKVFLELTPPAHQDQLLLAGTKLYNALYGLSESRTYKDKLLLRRPILTPEIVATRDKGIRFIVVTPKHLVSVVEHHLHSSVPDLKIARTKDYLASVTGKPKIYSFFQKKHFMFPLQSMDNLESHDPVGYITSAMTKLDDGEIMTIQMPLYPARKQKADSIRGKILRNEDVISKMQGGGFQVTKFFTLINTVLFGILDGVGSLANSGSSKNEYRTSYKDIEYQKQMAKHLKPVRTLSYFEHELMESIHNKLAEPLFNTEIRCLVWAHSKSELQTRKSGIKSALSLFNVPKYQALKLKRSYGLQARWLQFMSVHRLPRLFRAQNVLSSTELASLYHFPNSFSAKTENVVKSLSKTLPAPVSLKGSTKLDFVLGENIHQGSTTTIGLTEAERDRHVYIIGGTGNGKTTMLQYGIVQDMKAGKGLAVLDPHGDMAETLLSHIPEDRINDVIYLNPDDLSYPIGVNLLELPERLTGDDLLREKDLVTESTISVMRKIFSDDDSGGHRIEYVLRNAIQTALTLEEPTLFTIFELLNDSKFRRNVVKQLEDKDLKNFWNNELGKAGEFQKVKMVAGITAKVGRFLFSASAKRILEQPKSTIDFGDIMDSGKILICNFSKGLLGEDTSTLFGTTILAKIQVAALRRARTHQAERKPFYLYVDEFQNFATMSFVQMLSEARKYKLFLTMAEQSTSQQDQQRLVDIILANVGTVICFRSGSPADERYVLPLFTPYVNQGEIANLPAYNFYMRIAALEPHEPLSGKTILLSGNGSEDIALGVKVISRETYGREVVLDEETKSEPTVVPKQTQQKRRPKNKSVEKKVLTRQT